MRHLMLVELLLLGGCAAPGKPMVLVAGEYAYINGQKVPLEQKKQMKANGILEQFTTLRGPAPLAGAPVPPPGALPQAGGPQPCRCPLAPGNRLSPRGMPLAAYKPVISR